MARKIIVSIAALITLFVITHLLAFLDSWQSLAVVDAWQEGSYDASTFTHNTKRLPPIWQETVAWLLAEKNAQYEDAVAYRENASEQCNRNTDCAIVYGNRWTSLWYYGKAIQNTEEQRAVREEALRHFTSSLALQSSERVEHNKKVVEERLKQNQQEEWEEWEEWPQEQGNQDEQDNQDNQDGQDSQDEQEGQSSQDESDQEQFAWQEQSSLSQYQKEQLEQYQKQLERNEQENQQYFAPTGQQQQGSSPFDQLFGNRLQKQLPNSEGVKDW